MASTNETDVLVTTERGTFHLMSNSTDYIMYGDYETPDQDLVNFRTDIARIGEGYILFTICVLGCIGNTLAFVTFCSKRIRESTTSVYLRALAIADILVLVTAIFRFKTYKLFLSDAQEVDSVFYVDAYVEVYVEPIHWIALGSSSFITIALSLERYLAVKYPLLVKRFSSIRTVLVCVCTAVLIVVLITVPNFVTYRVTEFRFSGLTLYVATLTSLGEQSLYPCTFHNYVIPVVWYLVPAAFLSSLNILLSLHVRKSSRIRVGLPNVCNPNRNLTVLIIVILSVYIVCNFPKCIFVFYKLVNGMSEGVECIQRTSKISAPDSKSFLVGEVTTELLNVLNSCLNFVVYCLFGSRFRRQLKNVLACRWRPKTESWSLEAFNKQHASGSKQKMSKNQTEVSL